MAQSRRSFGADPRLEAYATLGPRLEAYAFCSPSLARESYRA